MAERPVGANSFARLLNASPVGWKPEERKGAFKPMRLLQIVERVAERVQDSPHIHAMWLEGSYATGKANEDSDIDVWLDVDDNTFEESVQAFRDALSEVATIDHETTRGVYSVDPKLTKQTFFLKDFPPGQEVELDLQEHSRGFIFSRSEHTITILFDKDGTIKWRESHDFSRKKR